MALLNTLQAENGQLNSGTILITDTECTPSGNVDNAVFISQGPSNFDFISPIIPSGATKIQIWYKKVANAAEVNINVNYIGGSGNLYGVAGQSSVDSGLQMLEVTPLPTESRSINIDGNGLIIDRLEFHDNVVVTPPAIVYDIQPVKVGTSRKSGNTTYSEVIYINKSQDIIPANSIICLQYSPSDVYCIEENEFVKHNGINKFCIKNDILPNAEFKMNYCFEKEDRYFPIQVQMIDPNSVLMPQSSVSIEQASNMPLQVLVYNDSSTQSATTKKCCKNNIICWVIVIIILIIIGLIIKKKNQ